MTKKITLLFTAGMLLTACMQAQSFPYTLTVLKQAYVPLTTGTEFYPGTVWDGDYTFITPMGFNLKVDTIHCNTFFSEGATSFETDTVANRVAGLLFCDATLEDRGSLTGTVAKSPVRHQVTGIPGSRIFKFETYNAGFYDELHGFGTMSDSVSVQIWFYEGSNIMELRYGPSRVAHFSDYFDLGGPLTAYANLDTGFNGMLYSLYDDPSAPSIDTLHVVNGNPTTAPSVLTSWPTDSTVYRFTPITSAVKEVHAAQASVYPTTCTDHFTIDAANDNHMQYQVMSVSGSDMNLKGNLKAGKNTIDISGLPNGMYLVQIQSTEGRMTYKIIKN